MNPHLRPLAASPRWSHRIDPRTCAAFATPPVVFPCSPAIPFAPQCKSESTASPPRGICDSFVRICSSSRVKYCSTLKVNWSSGPQFGLMIHGCPSSHSSVQSDKSLRCRGETNRRSRMNFSGPQIQCVPVTMDRVRVVSRLSSARTPRTRVLVREGQFIHTSGPIPRESALGVPTIPAPPLPFPTAPMPATRWSRLGGLCRRGSRIASCSNRRQRFSQILQQCGVAAGHLSRAEQCLHLPRSGFRVNPQKVAQHRHSVRNAHPFGDVVVVYFEPGL